jgi:hypothetical protein
VGGGGGGYYALRLKLFSCAFLSVRVEKKTGCDEYNLQGNILEEAVTFLLKSLSNAPPPPPPDIIAPSFLIS